MNLTSDQIQRINIKIAEACGWTGVYKHPQIPDPIGFEKGKELFKERIPSYATDLNAMAEAENTLSDIELDLYASYLDAEIKPGHVDSFSSKLGAPQLSWRGVFSMIRATAPHRAVCFLKANGINWEAK